MIEVINIRFTNAPENIGFVVNEVVEPARLKEMYREALRSDLLESFEK